MIPTRQRGFVGPIVRRVVCALGVVCWGVASGGWGEEPSDHSLTRIWTSEDGLPDSSVTSLAQTPDGYLWVGTYNGLARFDGLTFKTFDPDNTPALAHARIRLLAVDRRGTLWISTFDGSLTTFRDGQFAREWTCKVRDDRDNALVASGPGHVVFVLDQGEFYAKLLDRAPGEGWEQLALPNRTLLTQPFGEGGCLAWYKGPAKRLWHLEDRQFLPVVEATGLPGQRIMHARGDAQGRIWVGTDQGIARLEGTNVIDLTPTNGEPTLQVRLFHIGEDGGLWVEANGRVRKAMGCQWVIDGGSMGDVFNPSASRSVMLDDHQGGIWLRDYGRGVAHFSADGGVWKFSARGGFNTDRATSLIEDREGNIWAGFEMGGLA